MTEEKMGNIVRVPVEMVKIIPIFDGDARLLPLFIKKCEYILQTFGGGNLQNEYLFHVITSRLVGDAANFVGEREQIDTWDELKLLLGQHFGDPRSEDCLSMELESMRINRSESYLEFCHRIQHLRSILFSKISETIDDANERQAKHSIYNNHALNVFLYNLPPFLVRLVRLRNVKTLEDALKTVLEEQNFQTVYDNKNPRPNRNFNPNHNFNSNTPRFNNSFQQYASHNLATNYQNNRSQFHSNNNQNQTYNFPQNSQNNSMQFRNNYRAINSRNNNHAVSRSAGPAMPAERSQHFADAAPRMAQNYSQPMPSGSNTDVTMRTASSRRVNYTDNNQNNQPCTSQQYNEHSTYYNSNEAGVENFYMMASHIQKK